MRLPPTGTSRAETCRAPSAPPRRFLKVNYLPVALSEVQPDSPPPGLQGRLDSLSEVGTEASSVPVSGPGPGGSWVYNPAAKWEPRSMPGSRGAQSRPAPTLHGRPRRPGASRNPRPLPARRDAHPKCSQRRRGRPRRGEGMPGLRKWGVRGARRRDRRGTPRGEERGVASREARLRVRFLGGEAAPGQRREEGGELGSESGVGLREEGAGARGVRDPGSGCGRLPAGGPHPALAAQSRPAPGGTHLRAGRAGSAARGLGSQRPRLCGLRWAPVEAEPRRRRRCTAAFRFLSRRRPAAPAQPCEPGAAASQEQRARPAPPRAQPTCSRGRGLAGDSPPPRRTAPLNTHTHTHSVTHMSQTQRSTPPTQHSNILVPSSSHTHAHTHTQNHAQNSSPFALTGAQTHIFVQPRV